MAARDHRIGLMTQPNVGYLSQVPFFKYWAADNAAYSSQPASLEKLLAWARRLPTGAMFLSVPDIVGDAQATYARWREYSPLLRREFPFPLAYVGQDGLTDGLTPWDEFEVLFLGGSTEWKLAQAPLVAEALGRGKWVHMGRVNSRRRLRVAHAWGCQSADGTFIKYRDRLAPGTGIKEIVKWLDALEAA